MNELVRRDITINAEVMKTRRTSIATRLRRALRTPLYRLLSILRLPITTVLLVRSRRKRSQTTVALETAFLPGFLPADFGPVAQREEVVV